MSKVTEEEIMVELLTLMAHLFDKETRQKEVGSSVVKELHRQYKDGEITAEFIFENRHTIAQAFREEVALWKSESN